MGKAVIYIIFGLMAATTGLRLHIQGSATKSVDKVGEEYCKEMVRNIANGGANFALTALTVNVDENTPVTNASLSGGDYSYYFERDTEDPTLGSTQVRVTAIGNYEGLSDTIVVLMTRPSFSRYAWFTDYEGDIWFYTGDTLRGPAHTNTYFQMAGEPVFYGKVTSHLVYNSSTPYRKYDSSTNPHFYGGTEWQVPQLTMPTQIPQETIDAAQSGGLYFNNRYVWMNFQSDGTVDICAKNTSSTPQSWEYTTYNIGSTNGTFYIYYYYRPTVRVEGTVNGQVTVASRGYIYVEDDLVCADDPQTNPYSDDMIGLVAERDISVRNNQYLQDRTIQASIMTLNPTSGNTRNFYVYPYDQTEYGTLHVYGGIIQQARGAVGTFGYHGRTGYLKDYEWDSRLSTISPPNFPCLFVLRKIAWWD
jgi:hypothetical protein